LEFRVGASKESPAIDMRLCIGQSSWKDVDLRQDRRLLKEEVVTCNDFQYQR
jgi:hypothetical protein